MKGEALSQAYASGDVFVMPSESETLGFVALEAMASRVPVVAVAAGGLTDIITRPGENGVAPVDLDTCHLKSAVDPISHYHPNFCHLARVAENDCIYTF